MKTALSLSLLIVTSGCNLALGIDDHETIPANCGVEGVEMALSGFGDVRTGHCYSVAVEPGIAPTCTGEEGDECPNRLFASNKCSQAGGYLACITDVEEFNLINQNVTNVAWLGMRFEMGNALPCDNGETFSYTLPIWRDGAPNTDDCSTIEGATVTSRWCGSNTFNQWLCEFDLAEAP